MARFPQPAVRAEPHGPRTGAARGKFRRRTLNYRHHFHAGNFADLVKHAVLLALLERLTAEPGPLEVVDTHAGAGLYDITAEAARRSAEAQAGVVKLMAAADAPPALVRLRDAVAALNGGGPVRLYPGSPVLAVRGLRPGDRYSAFELRPDDQAELARALKRQASRGVTATAALADGFDSLARAPGRRLVLIDPPFERGDDYERMVEVVGRAGDRQTIFALWTPLKDLETFDGFLGALEQLPLRVAGLAVEARLRPLDNPLRLNGCALVLLGERRILDAVRPEAEAVCDWTARALGEVGATARLEPLFFSN